MQVPVAFKEEKIAASSVVYLQLLDKVSSIFVPFSKTNFQQNYSLAGRVNKQT